MSLSTSETCPKCSANLRGEAIPEFEAVLFYEPGVTHFSRVVNVEYDESVPNGYWYDGVSEWRCPDCGYREGRWTGRELAEGELEPRWGAKP